MLQSNLPADVSRILFVKHLPYNFSNEDMYNLFGRYGAVRQIRVYVEALNLSATATALTHKRFMPLTTIFPFLHNVAATLLRRRVVPTWSTKIFTTRARLSQASTATTLAAST
jgi:RNA recognition motif-containing protein